MKVFKTKKEIVKVLNHFRHSTIGFVPTMGALHQGHLSLMKRCRENSIRVASIFVNPTQFNDKNDLANYPRSLESDIAMLASTGCDFVFAPTVEEMYPEEDTRIFHFGMLEKVMEGAQRPGHFAGVAQIVSKLFEIVQPVKAYFGEKDFQQLVIIRKLVDIMNYPIEIVGCPTVREADGLAMSSRNALLTAGQRKEAPVIARTLFACKEKSKTMSLNDLKKWVIQQIDSSPELKTEYFDIVDQNTLQTAAEYGEDALQGCIAVRAGNIRLIDNIRI